jgi:hypothetical protein
MNRLKSGGLCAVLIWSAGKSRITVHGPPISEAADQDLANERILTSRSALPASSWRITEEPKILEPRPA